MMVAPSRPRTSRAESVLAVLEPIGTVLVLQLLAAIVSLGVVTALPATLAVQRGVAGVLDGDTAPSPVVFVSRTGRTLRQLWPVCVALPVLVVAWTLAVLFWASRAAPASWLGAGTLCVLGGVAVVTLLGALSQPVPQASPATAWRYWLRMGFTVAAGRPLRAAAAVVLVASWLLLVMRLPTLLLLTSAAVPALLATWLVREPSTPVRRR